VNGEYSLIRMVEAFEDPESGQDAVL
jgi:hypothetical protein